MKRRTAKFLKILCFLISIIPVLVACRGDVNRASPDSDAEDIDSTDSIKNSITNPSAPPAFKHCIDVRSHLGQQSEV